MLAEAVRATLTAFDFEAPGWQDWLGRTEVDPEELEVIRRQHDAGGVPVLWSTVRELRGRERAAYLWAVAAPSRQVLADRGETSAGRVWRGLRRVSGTGVRRQRRWIRGRRRAANRCRWG